jgi:hypothetical protein
MMFDRIQSWFSAKALSLAELKHFCRANHLRYDGTDPAGNYHVTDFDWSKLAYGGSFCFVPGTTLHGARKRLAKHRASFDDGNSI